LHPEKTRLLEFGRHAAEQRKKHGQGKPETFNFLGFTHICGKTRDKKRFTVLRHTIRKRVQAKLSEVKLELTQRMHAPVPEAGEWLRSVVGGHLRYYGVPTNSSALAAFRWAGSGIAPYRGEAKRVAFPGSGCAGSSSAGCRPRASLTPIH
jgi:hypothetical protein